MSKILVTGGAGFIGSHLTKKLLGENNTIICIDDLNNYYSPKFKQENISSFKKNNNWKFFQGDIRDKEFLKKVFKKTHPDKIIHLAARVGVRPSIIDPNLYYDVNLVGTTNLLELARDFKVGQFILGSSSSVYGNDAKIPFSEDDLNLNPISPYGLSKLAAEKTAKIYNLYYSIPITCLRFFTVYGPNGRPDMAPYLFTQAIYHGKTITRFGSGESLRDYTYIDDIINGIELATKKIFKFEIINLGNSSPVTLNKFIEIIENITGKKAKIKTVSKQEGDVKKTFANIKKAKKLLGWKPSVSLDEGIMHFFDWYLKSGRANK